MQLYSLTELIATLRDDASSPLNDDGDVMSSDSLLIEAANALVALRGIQQHAERSEIADEVDAVIAKNEAAHPMSWDQGCIVYSSWLKRISAALRAPKREAVTEKMVREIIERIPAACYMCLEMNGGGWDENDPCASPYEVCVCAQSAKETAIAKVLALAASEASDTGEGT